MARDDKEGTVPPVPTAYVRSADDGLTPRPVSVYLRCEGDPGDREDRQNGTRPGCAAFGPVSYTANGPLDRVYTEP
jgi:hypothetical protein